MQEQYDTDRAGLDFESMSQMVSEAIVRKDYGRIDRFIDEHVSELAKVRRMKTPIFAAVEKVLGNSAHLQEESAREQVVALVGEGLEHIFKRVEIRLDRELSDDWIHAACNHISPSRLFQAGATVRDLLEQYAGIDLEKPSYGEDYSELRYLVDTYGLENKSTVMQERIKQTATSYKDKEGRGRL